MKFTYDLIYQTTRRKYISFKKCCICICIILVTVTLLTIIASKAYIAENEDYMKSVSSTTQQPDENIHVTNFMSVAEYYSKRENISLSKLGEIMFKEAKYPEIKSNIFKILIWKDGIILEKRHVYFFSSERRDPFGDCSVKNCVVTYEADDLNEADAVVFYLQNFQGLQYLPNNVNRLPSQRWIFLTDQSPFNTFRLRKENDWRNYSNIFNWSMTYKMESDIPVPYGRTVLLTTENKEDFASNNINKTIPHLEEKQRNILLAIKTTDCDTDKRRVQYVEELKKYLTVDIYGKCATDPHDICSRYSHTDCKKLNRYFFYLAFENSNCDQFMTENLFWFGYFKGAIPIIMGPSVENCELLLPPNSYIHINNFVEPLDLANYILYLNKTWDEQFFNYHKWRTTFNVLNEHGYYGVRSYHYCRICEALNYNDENSKTYTDLSRFLSIENNCNY